MRYYYSLSGSLRKRQYGFIQKKQYGLFSPEMELWRKAVALNLAVAIFFFALNYFYNQPKLEAKAAAPAVVTSTPATSTPERTYKTVYAYVTGYNTVPEQTDSRPCKAATGANICGRSDVVTCSRDLPLGTEIEISGKTYKCLDRTARKYDARFDVSCDKDMKCPYKLTGWQNVKIYID